MHLKRTIIIPAIMALSAVGSVLAGSAVTLAATSAPSVAVVTASSAHPDVVFNW
jgi:4-hydroxybenzoate polyprenyltransferase